MKSIVASPYTETLGQALEAVRSEMEKYSAIPVDDSWVDVFTFGGISYETRKEAHSELTSFRGKPTRKWLHVTIYRLSSGRYEWTVYFL